VVPEENIFEKVMAIAHTGELKKTNRTMEKKKLFKLASQSSRRHFCITTTH
jgi:hypothetical protein